MRGVCFRHHDNLPLVLDHVDFSVEEGARSLILGANGAGKTTLFYSLAGVYKPKEGEILCDGRPIEYTKEGLTGLRRDVAVVLQNPDEQMFSSTVEEDVAFGPMNLGLEHDEVDERIGEALRDVRMSEHRKRPLQQLSGGQRKKIAIAGALAVRPKVMIMDEPTAGLDPQSALEVMELAEKLHNRGVTVIISTHDVDLAYAWSDSANIMAGGKMVFSGSSDGFYSDNERTMACGLMKPSICAMNYGISRIAGCPLSPFPHTVGEYVAKFEGSRIAPGRLFCVPYSGGDLSEAYSCAVSEAGKDARVGLYGSSARSAVSEEGLKVDFYFDGIDSALTEAVLGRDAVLLYDREFQPTVDEHLSSVLRFKEGVDKEVVG